MDTAVLTQWMLSAVLGAVAAALAVRSIYMRRSALTNAQHSAELAQLRSQHEQASATLKDALSAEHERARQELQERQATALQTERTTCQREVQAAAHAAEASIASLTERHAQQIADMQARTDVQVTTALLGAEREHQSALAAERERLLILQQERLDAAERRFEERLQKVESPMTLEVHPFVNSTGKKLGPYDSTKVQVGYKYQLLVQGVPCFDAHEVVIEEQSKVEVDDKALAEWAEKAAALAQRVVSAKVGGVPGRLVSFASTVLRGHK
jgi:hypothetical protein